jgi:uncharacterized SAM-binding protein YcdF (DUF218 family)
MSFVKGLFTLIIIAMVVIVVLFVDFAYKTFSFRQRDVKTDAIVVLAGGKGRIEEGLRLYRAGEGRTLMLIGVGQGVRKTDIIKDGGEMGDGIALEKVSRNTLENAIYARELLTSRNVSSIKLITSRYHMKRATLIFRSILPKDVAIYPHPVSSSNLKETWWSHGGSFRLLFTEFYKYCLFRLFFLFGSGELKSVKSVASI